MKNYVFNRQTKDPRFLAAFRKSFNKDRIQNGFTYEESSNEMGLSRGTLEQKLKPSAENDITVTEWNHLLDLTGDFSTLEYFALKHGFEIKKLDINNSISSSSEVGVQADKAMIEFNEAWAKVKNSLLDNKFDRKEKNETLKEISEAIKELQQLQHDVEYIKFQE